MRKVMHQNYPKERPIDDLNFAKHNEAERIELAARAIDVDLRLTPNTHVTSSRCLSRHSADQLHSRGWDSY